MVTGSPTFRWSLSALPLLMSTVWSFRSVIVPSTNSKSNIWPATVGSTTETVLGAAVDLGARRAATPAAASTSGSWLSCWATVRGRPPKPCVLVFTTKSPVNCLSKMSRTDALIDAASTEMPATRATPIISAAAVRAVRFGLRMAFSWAMPTGDAAELRQWGADDPGERAGRSAARARTRR